MNQGYLITLVCTIVSIVIIPPSFAGTSNFKYDDLHRLTQVTSSNGTVTTYDYDNFGNRTSLTTVSDTSSTTAIFSAIPTSGSTPLAVNFTDQSTGTITAWIWDFDNDGSVDSTEQNPSNTYSTPGIYEVRLTVIGPTGTDSEQKADYIHVLSVQESYTLTTSVNGNGTITSSPTGIVCGNDCQQSYSASTVVGLSATPEPGRIFTGWGGECTGTGSCSVTMDSDITVAASFSTLNTQAYNLTASPAAIVFYGNSISGQPIEKILTVTNTGTEPITVDSISLTGTDIVNFSLLPSDSCTGQSISTGESCSASVSFLPTTEGYKQAVLSVDTVTGEIDTLVIPISGTGLMAGSTSITNINTATNITHSGDISWHAIELTAGEGVTVALDANMGNGYLDFGIYHPHLISAELAGSNDSRIYDQEKGSLVYTPEVSGVYYIKVWGSSGAFGNFDLAVYDAWFNAGTVDSDRNYYSSTYAARYFLNGTYPLSDHTYDYLRFTAKADEDVVINLTGHLTVGYLNSSILDHNGTALAGAYYNNITNGETGSISYTPAVSGVYYLRITRLSGAFGTYDLSMNSGYQPDVDNENDNLYDAAEYYHGTNLNLSDTDGDGQSDSNEIAAGR